MSAESMESTRAGIEKGNELLQGGRIAEAAVEAERILAADSENGEALYLLAVCQRYLSKTEAALASIQRLQTLRPSYGRAFQEEGHIYVAANRMDEAEKAYERAVARNDSLIASWKSLIGLYTQRGAKAAAREAEIRFRVLDDLPQELLSVRNMTVEKHYFRAERLCRYFLKQHPKNIEGMRLLADLGVRSGVLDDAEFLLESAVEFDPKNRLARFDYMNVLYRRQKYEMSFQQASILRDAEPKNLDYQIGYANQCVAIGRYNDALEIYDAAIDKLPNRAELHLVRGHALKTTGDVAAAIEAYRATYTARHDFGDAYWSLANLKTYNFTDDETAAMHQAESAQDTSVEDKIHLNFALGKHFEDVSNFAESARYYASGNALKLDEVQYSATRMSERLTLQIQHCDTELFASHDDCGNPSADPIFIVGLPRAGSTLLEQILASHSQVDGTLELPNIPALAHHLAGRRHVDEDAKYPEILTKLSDEKLTQFGDAFMDDTRVHRGDAPFFIDKMPNNFRHIGLIQLILPNARIIDARRHPMACCFSGYKQLFASGQEFTYGLDQIGRYYRDYLELMDHWDTVLPGKILRVQYEDVVADVETEVRRILEYCGLPFEQGCIDFYETQRSVRTPSSEQVRQPIFTGGLDQWRNYEPWLDELKSALGPALERYPAARGEQAAS